MEAHKPLQTLVLAGVAVQVLLVLPVIVAVLAAQVEQASVQASQDSACFTQVVAVVLGLTKTVLVVRVVVTEPLLRSRLCAAVTVNPTLEVEVAAREIVQTQALFIKMAATAAPAS